MRILFIMRTIGYLRNFEAVMLGMMDRGHSIELAVELGKSSPTEQVAWDHLETLSRTHPGLTVRHLYEEVSQSEDEIRSCAARDAINYLRYLTPLYDKADSLRARAHKALTKAHRALADAEATTKEGRERLAARLQAALDAMPIAPGPRRVLLDAKPDMIWVSPLVANNSRQVEYLRAAHALGIPAVLCVASWDNLTNKGLIHGAPEAVMVWNEAQKAEAVELHGMAPEAVHVTGAHTYDHWFDWTATRDRTTLMTDLGLDPQKPLILYLCSSPFIARTEIDFIEPWLTNLRAQEDPLLADAGVLIRPHPQNPQDWDRLDGRFENIAVWPRAGANPVGPDAKSDYYDSLNAAALVVGINTSGLIEAGIQGKPVYSMSDHPFAGNQDGTVHFQHLRNVNGGLLKVAGGYDEHFRDIAQGLRDPADGAARARAFVEAFVRPGGADTPARDTFVSVIEGLPTTTAKRPVKAGWIQRFRARRLLRALADPPSGAKSKGKSRNKTKTKSKTKRDQ